MEKFTYFLLEFQLYYGLYFQNSLAYILQFQKLHKLSVYFRSLHSF